MADPEPHPNCQACDDIERLTDAYREALHQAEARRALHEARPPAPDPHLHTSPDGGITGGLTAARDDGDPGPRGHEKSFPDALYVDCTIARAGDKHVVHLTERCRCRIQDGFDRRGR